MRPATSYTTTPYRVREYSQSPIREPICQNPPKRQNASIDHRTTFDYYDSIKDNERSYARTKTDGVYALSREPIKKDATVVKRYDYSQGNSYMSGYSVTSKIESTQVQTPIKILGDFNKQEKPRLETFNQDHRATEVRGNNKVLFIDVENKIEEEVLMELYMRICALSMENERQRLKNADLLKFQTMIINLLTIREESLRVAEQTSREYQAQVSELNQKMSALINDSKNKQTNNSELSIFRTRNLDLENRIKLLASENERLLDMKRNQEKEITLMRQEFLQENKRLADANSANMAIQTEKDKLIKINSEYKQDLNHKDEYLRAELSTFENEAVAIKRSYEERLAQLTVIIRSKERETEGLKEELNESRRRNEQNSSSMSGREKQLEMQLRSCEAKISETRNVIHILEQKKDDETVILKESMSKLNEQVSRLQFELQRREEAEFSQKKTIDQLNSKNINVEQENRRLTGILQSKAEAKTGEALSLFELTESLKKQIAVRDEEMKNKQQDYTAKIMEFTEKVRAERNETIIKSEEISKMESQMRELRGHNENLRQECENMKDAVVKSKLEAQKHEPDLAEKLKNLQKTAETDKHNIKKTYENQIAELTSRCNALIEERTQLSAEYNQFKLRASKDINELREVNLRLSQQQQQKSHDLNNELTSRFSELEAKLIQAESSLSSKTGEITKLHQIIEQLNEKTLLIDLERNSTDKRVSETKRVLGAQMNVIESKLHMQTDKYNQLKAKYDQDLVEYETKIRILTEQTVTLELQEKSERKRAAHDAMLKQQELNRELLILKDENGKLKEARDAYKTQIAVLKEEFSKLEEKYNAELQLAQKSRDNDYLRQKLDSLLLKSSEYETSLETYKLDNVKLKTKLKETQQRHAAVLTELQISLEQAENNHLQYRVEAEQERYRLTSELDAVQNEAQRLRGKLTRLEEVNGQLLAKQKDLMDMVESAEGGELSKRTKMVELQDRLDSAIRSLENEKKHFATEKRELVETYELKVKRAKDEAYKREEQLIEEYRVLKNNYNELKIEMDNTSADKLKLQRVVENMDSSILSDNAGIENVELRKHLELLKREHRGLQDDYEQIQQHYNKSMRDMEDIYTKRVNDYEDRIDELHKELALYRDNQHHNSLGLKEKAAEYEAHFHVLNKQLEMLEQRYNDLNTEHIQLESKYEASRSKNTELDQAIEGYENQVETLKRHLKENEEELNRLNLEFQRNIGAISSWQLNKEDITQENMQLRMLCDDRLREIEELAERRDDALVKVFQLSLVNEGLKNELINND